MLMLRDLRKAKGMTLKDVGAYLGVAESTVSQYENGKREADYESMLKLGELFGVSLDYLLRGDIYGMISDSGVPGILPVPKTVKRPRLGTIACGEPILCAENIECEDDVPEDIHCDFTLICHGDSMIGARIHDGDVVYIRQQSDVENREIAAVLIDEERVTLKRVKKNEQGRIVMLLAENPAYDPIDLRDVQSVRILGKAVGFTSIIKY